MDDLEGSRQTVLANVPWAQRRDGVSGSVLASGRVSSWWTALALLLGNEEGGLGPMGFPAIDLLRFRWGWFIVFSGVIFLCDLFLNWSVSV